MVIKGKDVLIFKVVTVNGTEQNQNIAAAKSCDISVDSDSIEVSGPTSGQWREYIAGRKTWTVMLNYLLKNDTDHFLEVGNIIKIRVSVRGDSSGNGTITPRYSLSGMALCRTCKATATYGNLVQGSFVFQGTGALTEDATPS